MFFKLPYFSIHLLTSILEQIQIARFSVYQMQKMPAKTTISNATYPQNTDFINKMTIFVTKTLDKSNKMLYICTIKNQKSKTMNKAELIDAIASGAKLTKADAAKALDATIEAISKALKKGDRIQLIGFGSFSVSKRSARTGRNPQTGKEIKIPAKKVVKFKAGSELANSVNKGK